MEYKKSNIDGIIYDAMDEYTIKKFIAVGGESIVFKGIKKSVGRTYALKFREIDRWGDFFSYELQTLSRLEQCSTSKLAGVIPEIRQDIVFCIVEDYIAGCDLKEYCDGDELKGLQLENISSICYNMDIREIHLSEFN